MMLETIKIPAGNWHKNLINCRQCKRRLVVFLGKYFLKKAQLYLKVHQTLYIAGAFEGDGTDVAWFAQGQNAVQPEPKYLCTAEETDTRIWAHIKNTESNHILVLSPDTDIYHIGCALHSAREKDVVVQLSKQSSRQLKFLRMSHLISALQRDPDFSHVSQEILPQVLRTLYVTTGCDYISFFSKIGKATFFKYLCQYANFITGGSDTRTPGTLADVSLSDDNYKLGFLSFVRLVGAAYFKLHSTGFNTPSPATHFNSFINSQTDTLQHHLNWLDSVRQNIWYRVNPLAVVAALKRFGVVLSFKIRLKFHTASMI